MSCNETEKLCYSICLIRPSTHAHTQTLYTYVATNFVDKVDFKKACRYVWLAHAWFENKIRLLSLLVYSEAGTEREC